MKLDAPIYAIINPATGEVLGDGECPALSPSPPDAAELEYVKRINECPTATVVQCKLVHMPRLDRLP